MIWVLPVLAAVGVGAWIYTSVTEEEQQDVRDAFTENGYDGQSIEFDRYEEHYPVLMRMKRYK